MVNMWTPNEALSSAIKKVTKESIRSACSYDYEEKQSPFGNRICHELTD